MAVRYKSLGAFKAKAGDHLAKGPVALVLVEDKVEVASTVRHHMDLGFQTILCFGSPEIDWPAQMPASVVRVDHPVWTQEAMVETLNTCIDAAAEGVWLYYCYNAEYLFFPFCEHRTIGELTGFLAEERRASCLSYVVDLYAGDLGRHKSAVSLEDAHLDKSGYYALARADAQGKHLDRQMNFYGGLRWRFEEHIPQRSRRIDRVGLFRVKPGLRMNSDHTLNDAEYNTYACPWHNSATVAICSFRTAKALKRNPGSTYDIGTFWWHKSTRFDWHSQQLLDLGLMEPGQWF